MLDQPIQLGATFKYLQGLLYLKAEDVEDEGSYFQTDDDLFSGSGSFGLECLSRNAKHVTFVENHNPALKILKKNILSLKLENNYKIIEKDIFNIKKSLNLKKKFDLIFADPPYKENKINKLLNIFSMSYLNKNGLFLLHRNKNSDTILNENFNLLDKRIYGISKIIFYQLK